MDDSDGITADTITLRIVLDTASFVTAIRSSGGAAGEVLRMVFRQELVPLMDLKLTLEYGDVALRPEHVDASTLSAEEILELVELVAAFAEPVDVLVKTRPLSPDPNDDMVLDLAINGQADAVITNNTRHFRVPCRKHGIRVFTPSEFLTWRREEHHGD